MEFPAIRTPSGHLNFIQHGQTSRTKDYHTYMPNHFGTQAQKHQGISICNPHICNLHINSHEQRTPDY
ncbi:MAG TPA: hypothetical protein VFJ43_15280 [Bacteroidia bacterium]|nr:hypothetical protein [Bacteroidia bacterium]